MTRAKRRLLDRRMSLFAESKARGLGSHRGLKREALESLGGAPFLRLPLFQGPMRVPWRFRAIGFWEIRASGD